MSLSPSRNNDRRRTDIHGIKQILSWKSRNKLENCKTVNVNLVGNGIRSMRF